jgi:L-lactate dehydrogenase complex protein LldG
MSSNTTSPVETALSSVDIFVERVSADEFGAAIESVASDPAVGVSLEGFDVSLAGPPVTVDPTPAQLKAARTGVMPAACCITDYETFVLPADGAELVSLFVERHVVVLREQDVVETMADRFNSMDDHVAGDRGSAILATGPSATADMGSLVKGAHGPREVVAIVLES